MMQETSEYEVKNMTSISVIRVKSLSYSFPARECRDFLAI